MDENNNEQAAMVLARQIDAVLAKDRVFAVLPDGPLHTTQLRAHVSALAQKLMTQATPGATVAVSSISDRHVIAAVTTCLRLGYPVLICDPNAPIEETASLLRHSGAAVLITEVSSASAFKKVPGLCILEAGQSDTEPVEFPSLKPNDTALLVATSGTLDRPKIVELSHANLISQFDIFADVYGFNAQTRALNLLPLHHVDGLIRGPLLALWFEALLLRTRRFSVDQAPAILEDLEAHHATHLITVPAMLRILHRAQDPETFKTPESFRFVLCSADYLDAGLWQAVERDFGVPVVNAYGLSEVVCDALIAGPENATRVAATIGIARGLEAMVLAADGEKLADGEIGELAISGGTVMRGYLNDPDATAEVLKDGVLRTGDLVQRREDGLFEYKGRQKNIVVVGGVTIYPEAVTEVISGFPGVGEAYAFGHRHETGEMLLAAVCPLQGAHLDLDDVYTRCRAHLAPERQPSRIVILSDMPRRASGKVDRNAIVAAALPKNQGGSVHEIAAQCFGVSSDQVSNDSTPFNTAGWDSLAHMTFIEMLEETFDFTMSPQDIASLMSIADAIEIVEREVK